MNSILRFPRPAPAGLNRRGGATLVEVLMSLMVMGIGIVSVVTMFPIAALRSIQATQLTNAKMLRKNVEERIRMPTRTTYTNTPTSFELLNFSLVPYSAGQATESLFQGAWQPGTLYRLGEIVCPTRKKGEWRPELNRWFTVTTAGVSGPVEPAWVAGTTSTATDVADGTVTWRAEDTAATAVGYSAPTGYLQLIQASNLANLGSAYYYDALNYVVDPLGWQMFRTEPNLNTAQTSANDFGYNVVQNLGGQVAPATYTTPAQTAVNRRLLRLNGGMHNLLAPGFGMAMAEGITLHGDSWNQEVSDLLPTIPAAGDTTATFRPGLDIGADFAGRRIILTNEDRSRALVRNLTGIGGQTVTWANAEPIPAGFVPEGPARIERFDKRFSWLATVNRDIKGRDNVTVAVFFRRRFTPADEHVYPANYDFSDFGGVSPDQVQITWTIGTNPDPLLKEGNFLLDGYNATWYRIMAVSVTTTGTAGSATLTLDRAIPANLRNTAGRAILMRGIIHLFEL